MKAETIKELIELLDCIRDGIFITDGSAKVLLLNQSSEARCGHTRETIMGSSMEDLIKEGYFKQNEVVSLKCIASGKEERLIQKRNNKKSEVLVTGVPLIKNGKVDKVIVTEQDVSDLKRLEKDLRNNKRLAKKYKKELEYYRNQDSEAKNHIVYESAQMENAVRLAAKAAKRDSTVLIQGESGTGKEVIAKLIHNTSIRMNKPFVKINCGAIPENLLESELFGYEKGFFTGVDQNEKKGSFESADRGTLFWDEIGTLAPHLQVKLLRVLQEKEVMRIGGNICIPVNVRIIAATNINLKDAIGDGSFRSDLYYRLNVVPIIIEPLRNRKSDIRPLGEKFLTAFNEKYGMTKRISEDGWRLLLKYSWPGNVRELENFIERLVVLSDRDVIHVTQMTAQFPELELNQMPQIRTTPLKNKVEEYEKRLILSQMQYYTRTQELADNLGINKSTLTRKMRRYQIKNIYHD